MAFYPRLGIHGCHKCGGPHRVVECPKCYQCGEFGHKKDKCTKLVENKMKCYQCGEFGHKKDKCTKLVENKMKCYQCGEIFE
jgi:hypothetical protein